MNFQISTKSDVWSLGCILYSLVYNRTPFESIRAPLLKLQAIMNPAHEIEFPDTPNAYVVDVLKVNQSILSIYLKSLFCCFETVRWVTTR